MLGSSTQPDALKATLAKFPKHSAARYRMLLNAVAPANADVAFVWASPAAGERTGTQVTALSQPAVSNTVKLLKAIEATEQVPYYLDGRFNALHLRKRTFELVATNGSIVTGKIARGDAVEQARAANMQGLFRVYLSERLQTNEVSGHQAVARTLLSVKPLPETPGDAGQAVPSLPA